MRYVDENGICVVCRFKGVDLHHIKTRKSGGSDSKFNLLPLCHRHHVEIHNSGTTSFVKKYHWVGKWLVKNNWKFNGRKWHNKEVGEAHGNGN